MKLRKRSHLSIVFLIILFLLFAPPLQKESSAQDGEITPSGLGQPPDIGRDRVSNRGQETRSINTSELKYFAYLPLAVDPSPAASTSTCGENGQEKKLANLAKTHPYQGRPMMNCHPILNQVARERALDMGQNGYFNHINLDGFGPNYMVLQAGYRLPSWWPDSPDENYIESIAGGYTTADAAWDAWLKSQNHRPHVLGEVDFWAEQTNYGVGYAYVAGSPYGHYWVFITAPPEGS